MNELDKILYTKLFVDKLASGVNPLDDSPIPPSDLLRNTRISNCMGYVSDILGKVIANGGISPPKSSRNTGTLPFEITDEQIANVPLGETPISLSMFVKQINEQIDQDVYKKLKAKSVGDWLVDINMLFCEIVHDKSRKSPTEQGKSMGIFTEHRRSSMGIPYTVVLYSVQARQFILDNMDAIVAKNNAKKESLEDE